MRQTLRRAALVFCLSLAIACSGSDSKNIDRKGDAPEEDAATPSGSDPETGDDTSATITVHADVTNPNLISGWVYKHVGSAAVGRADIQQGTDALCTGTLGGAKCILSAKVGDTVTLIATDQGDVSFGGYSNANAPKDPRSPSGAPAQFVEWSAPCATPSRGVCVFEVTGDESITVQFKELTLTQVYFSGLDNWRYTIEAPPLLKVGPDYTGEARHIVYDYEKSTFYCLGGATPELCWYILTPDGASIRLEALPPPGTKPAESPGALAFRGWGGGCAINGINPVCDLSSGVDQTVIYRWEYYTCRGDPGVNNGTSGWKFAPGTRANCTVQP
jgi:hypothetical protein